MVYPKIYTDVTTMGVGTSPSFTDCSTITQGGPGRSQRLTPDGSTRPGWRRRSLAEVRAGLEHESGFSPTCSRFQPAAPTALSQEPGPEPSSEDLAELEYDVVVPLPPIRRYKVDLVITAVRKGKPVVVEP